MNDQARLQAVAEVAAGKPVENAALQDAMQKAREANGHSLNLLEDMAREIQTMERELQQKTAKFVAICAEFGEMPDRIRRGAL